MLCISMAAFVTLALALIVATSDAAAVSDDVVQDSDTHDGCCCR